MSKMDELLSLVKLPYDADTHHRNMETAINEQDELIQQLQQQNQEMLEMLKNCHDWLADSDPDFDVAISDIAVLIAKIERGHGEAEGK